MYKGGSINWASHFGVLKALEQGIYYCGFYVGGPNVGKPRVRGHGKGGESNGKDMEKRNGNYYIQGYMGIVLGTM